MSKGDFPPLRMIVENGRLVPAGQFDAERLASYRRGAVVMCRFSEEKDRVLVRKWFAIIGLVLKTCETPWKNKDEAHEAIKLALGIVNLSKTVGGQFMQYPKSLTELDDPEMTESLEQMTELLSRMTGVDVETLRKETAHITDISNPDEAAPSSSSVDAGESPSPATEAGEHPPQSPASTLSPVDRNLLIECAGKFFDITARNDLDAHGRQEALAAAKDAWKQEIRVELHPKLASLFMTANSIITGKNKNREGAIIEAANWLECEPKDIGGAA